MARPKPLYNGEFAAIARQQANPFEHPFVTAGGIAVSYAAATLVKALPTDRFDGIATPLLTLAIGGLVYGIVWGINRLRAPGLALAQRHEALERAVETAQGESASLHGFKAEAESLRTRVDEYERGPIFVLDIVQPLTVAHVKAGVPALAVIFSVRCTNEGAPGRTFDWKAWVETPDGRTIEIARITTDQINIAGAGRASMSRSDMIWERSAKTMERGHTEVGHFMGLLPGHMAATLDGEWSLAVACRDHRKRVFGDSYSVEAGLAGRAPIGTIAEPTLPTLLFDEKHYRPNLSGATGFEDEENEGGGNENATG